MSFSIQRSFSNTQSVKSYRDSADMEIAIAGRNEQACQKNDGLTNNGKLIFDSYDSWRVAQMCPSKYIGLFEGNLLSVWVCSLGFWLLGRVSCRWRCVGSRRDRSKDRKGQSRRKGQDWYEASSTKTSFHCCHHHHHLHYCLSIHHHRRRRCRGLHRR